MARRRAVKPEDILAILQSIPEDESESECQDTQIDMDSDEDFNPQNISSESEDSEETNLEVDLVRHRRQSARDQYRRELNPIPSTSANPRKRRYVYFEKLDFLRPIMEVTQ
ncbi:uncharacterized protein ACNLHF_018118 [Anomaloglossus baeobatrachus]